MWRFSRKYNTERRTTVSYSRVAKRRDNVKSPPRRFDIVQVSNFSRIRYTCLTINTTPVYGNYNTQVQTTIQRPMMAIGIP